MTIFDAKPTCFFHPIQVIFLDDNRAFLDALDLEFGEKYNIITVTSSDIALHLIDSNSYNVVFQSIFKSKSINDCNLDATNNRINGFDISKILCLIYYRTRFEHAPLLVIDYQMPGMNGIEFCKKIKGKKILKTMLTAEADKDTTIEAFNNGLIDKFILKTNENLYLEITSAIDDLTQQYFTDLSRNIVNNYDNSIIDIFDNKSYQQLFADVFIETKAVEYYLVDNSGSVLFLDIDAKPTWLIIRHAKELSDQFDLMLGYDLPPQTMESVAKKEKILFMLSEKEYKKPIGEWTNYLFDAKKLDNNYYYSVTKDYFTDSIDWGKVVSYSSYLGER